MWCIYKYLMPNLGEEAVLEFPARMRICDFHHQGENVYMWAVVDTTAPLAKRTITVIGTGWEIDNPSRVQFLKTVHMPNGCVHHVLCIHDEPEPKDDENALNTPNSDSTLALNPEADHDQDAA